MACAPAESRPAVGWHGKLPTLGDFTSRGLDHDFVVVWDEWLSAGLSRLRADSPDAWVDAYLASPTWRFVVTPRFLPAPLTTGIWTGVVMPSVDRVGRYYPLTLAGRLGAIPTRRDRQGTLWSWLQRLQDAAIDALQDDWTVAALDQELLRLGLPPSDGMDENGASPPPAAPGAPPDGVLPVSMESFFAACAHAFAASAAPGKCIWFTENEFYVPRVLRSDCMDDSIVRLWTV